MSKIQVFLLAGGKGTRLWPISTSQYPKQFLKINEQHSILQKICMLNQPLSSKPIKIITNQKYKDIASEQAGKVLAEGFEMILEPFVKNTAPCAAIASLISIKEKIDCVILVPADHEITGNQLYLDAMNKAIEVALSTENIVTIGIEPTFASTEYGYMHLNQKIESDSQQSTYRVLSFKEKPTHNTALQYLAQGGYLWNSGILVFRPDIMLSLFKKYDQNILMIAQQALLQSKKQDNLLFVDESYSNLMPNSIDYAILEKCSDISVIRGEFGWKDIGSWSSLLTSKTESSELDEEKFSKVITHNIHQCYLKESKLVSHLNIGNLLIIDNAESVFVSSFENLEDIPDIYKKIAAKFE